MATFNDENYVQFNGLAHYVQSWASLREYVSSIKKSLMHVLVLERRIIGSTIESNSCIDVGGWCASS